jgi:hypothetical protein
MMRRGPMHWPTVRKPFQTSANDFDPASACGI